MAESNELIASSSQTSFVTESSPAFKTPPPSSSPNGLNIIYCQEKVWFSTQKPMIILLNLMTSGISPHF